MLAADAASTTLKDKDGKEIGQVALTRTPNGVLMNVTLTGVAPGERAAVFARFARGANAAKGGSGLGLALVAQQAQLHGGLTYFEDSPLGGARLVIDLPARPAR